MTYNNYALFFKLDDLKKRYVPYLPCREQTLNPHSNSKVAAVLKEGLERTLSQARHLVGTIEKDADGHHSFVKRKDSTVKFVVQHLDTPDSSILLRSLKRSNC